MAAGQAGLEVVEADRARPASNIIPLCLSLSSSPSVCMEEEAEMAVAGLGQLLRGREAGDRQAGSGGGEQALRHHVWKKAGRQAVPALPLPSYITSSIHPSLLGIS